MTLDFVFKTCTGHDTSYWLERGELDWYAAYADPREDSGKGVLTANWNHFPRSTASDSHRSDEGKQAQDFNWNRGRKFQDILERMGYKLEWSDQTCRCDECGNVCVESDGHDCNQYWDDENGTTCAECTRTRLTSEYLEWLEGSSRRALGIHGIKLSDHGYMEVKCGYENGFHPGQNDDPRKIKAELKRRGYGGIVFEISDLGQFHVGFCVWVRETPVTALGINEYTGDPVPYEVVASGTSSL